MWATIKFRAIVITIALTLFASPQATRAQDVVVFAAARLTNALDEAARLFERQGGAHAKISYAAKVLARYSPICSSAPRRRASCSDTKKAAAPSPR